MVGGIWVRITDFPDYAISGEGVVMRISDDYHKTSGTLLKPHPTSSGYPAVRLYFGGKPKTVPIHRLIARHFIPNPENKPDVNHIDGHKNNSVFGNLEWATEKENTRHAWANGLGNPPRGAKCGTSKLTQEQVNELRSLAHSGASRRDLAAQFGISQSNVGFILSGKTWT